MCDGNGSSDCYDSLISNDQGNIGVNCIIVKQEEYCI